MKTKTQVRKSSPRRTQANDYVINLRVSAKTKRALDALARAQDRSRVAVIRMLLEGATKTSTD